MSAVPLLVVGGVEVGAGWRSRARPPTEGVVEMVGARLARLNADLRRGPRGSWRRRP